MVTEEQGWAAMVRRFFKWLVNVFAGHTVLQLIATVSVAYLAGLAVQFWQEAEAVFNAIPPMFWPVLAVLVLAVTAYHGFVSPFVTQARATKEKYRAQVENVYELVSHVYKPEILNPNKPGNRAAMLEYAQRDVDSLRSKLIHKYKDRKDRIVPRRIDVESPESLGEWYDFLREERVVASGS